MKNLKVIGNAARALIYMFIFMMLFTIYEKLEGVQIPDWFVLMILFIIVVFGVFKE